MVVDVPAVVRDCAGVALRRDDRKRLNSAAVNDSTAPDVMRPVRGNSKAMICLSQRTRQARREIVPVRFPACRGPGSAQSAHSDPSDQRRLAAKRGSYRHVSMTVWGRLPTSPVGEGPPDSGRTPHFGLQITKLMRRLERPHVVDPPAVSVGIPPRARQVIDPRAARRGLPPSALDGHLPRRIIRPLGRGASGLGGPSGEGSAGGDECTARQSVHVTFVWRCGRHSEDAFPGCGSSQPVCRRPKSSREDTTRPRRRPRRRRARDSLA